MRHDKFGFPLLFLVAIALVTAPGKDCLGQYRGLWRRVTADSMETSRNVLIKGRLTVLGQLSHPGGGSGGGNGVVLTTADGDTFVADVTTALRAIVLAINGDRKFSVDSTGIEFVASKLGIGEASPSHRLVIKQRGGSTGAILFDADASGTDSSFAVSETGRITTASVDSNSIVNGSISTSDYGNLSITSGKLGPSAVISGKIADNAITHSKMADNAIREAEMNWAQQNQDSVTSRVATATAAGKGIWYLPFIQFAVDSANGGTRDTVYFAQNICGSTLTIDSIHVAAASDDFTISFVKSNYNGGGGTLVDQVVASNNGIGLYYKTETEITNATLNNGQRLGYKKPSSTGNWVYVRIHYH